MSINIKIYKEKYTGDCVQGGINLWITKSSIKSGWESKQKQTGPARGGFLFSFRYQNKKKTKVKEKGEICAAKEGRKWMAFFGYQPQGARDSNNGILSCSLVSPSVQSAAIEAIRSLYLHATLRVLMHRNK